MTNKAHYLDSDKLIDVFSLTKTATAIHVGGDAVIQFANDAMLNIWGKDKSVIGKSLEDALPELKGQPFINMFRKVWNEGITISGKDTPADLEIDGVIQTFYFDFEYRAVLDSQGKTICILHSATDITDRFLRLEELEIARERDKALNREQALNEELASTNEELQAINEELSSTQSHLAGLNNELEERVLTRTKDLAESEERFRTMAEGSDMLIAVGDENGNTIYLSKAWYELTGRSISDMLTRGWVDLIHPDDRDGFLNAYATALAQRVAFGGEFRILGRNGEYRWLLCKNPPRFKPDGSFAGYISSSMDITDQKKEQQRKDDFIGMVSHELKTPLTSVYAYIDLLLKSAQRPIQVNPTSLLEKAKIQLNKMTKMINGFLNVSRLESGKLQIDKQVFDMADLVLDVKEETHATIHSHHFIFEPVEPTTVNADWDKIGHVINNFISNAVKYSAQGSNIQIACITEHETAILSVKDEGMGISEADQVKLFDRYYRVENHQMKTIAGFGIGLYLCSEIIQRHEGKIWVESTLGKGSTFYFTLPLAELK